MNRYALKLAWRHLFSYPAQSALLLVGVALGVGVFIFMSALIGGLATILTLRTIGNIPHVVIEMPERDPTIIAQGPVSGAIQKDLERREQIAAWQPMLPLIEKTPGVIAFSPQIRGSAFIRRGQAVAPVGVIGVFPEKLSAIANIGSNIVEGSANLSSDGLLIGSKLAQDLGLRVGQRVSLTSERGGLRTLRIDGIFSLGVSAADRQTVYLGFSSARALFDLPSGISRIEIKLADPQEAAGVADYLQRASGLKATPWTAENAQLFEALDSQGRTGSIIKTFALITITVGIASAMLLSIIRRKSEIGIMRAMGASRGFVTSIFLIEGTLIGLGGALLGAGLAWLALAPLPPIETVRSGQLPIDIAQGSFLLAVMLTTFAAMLASFLPARSAARIDPVEAIGN